MLWVDPVQIIALDDLLVLEPELPDMVRSEGLTLEGAYGLIRRAQSNAQTHLSQFLTLENLSASDLTLRNFNIPSFFEMGRNSTYAGMAQVMVSGETADHWSPIKAWLATFTLKHIYQVAVNRNADRYAHRMDMATDQLRSELWVKLRKFGIPLVLTPLPAPGAAMERSGRFTGSNLTLTAGAGTSTDEVDVAITWVSAESENNESHPSERVSKTLTNGNLLTVSLTGLTPPDGSQPAYTLATSRYTTRVATGWNVYVGRRGDTLYQQNVSPIALDSSYTLSGNPVYSGVEAGLGQHADLNLAIEANIRRS